jgi:hypothetical protein
MQDNFLSRLVLNLNIFDLIKFQFLHNLSHFALITNIFVTLHLIMTISFSNFIKLVELFFIIVYNIHSLLLNLWMLCQYIFLIMGP